MTPLLKVGLLIECFNTLDKVQYDEKMASDLLSLPHNRISEDILPTYMSQLGNQLAKEADAFKEALTKHAESWYKGYIGRLKELGVDLDVFEKKAQAYYGYGAPDLMAGGRRLMGDVTRRQIQMATEAPKDNRIVGDTSDLFRKLTGGGALGTAVDMGTYFIPGIGTIRTGLDAASDFTNMFSKGLDWKQRLGYLGSGLLNTGMTALDLVTLGVGGTAARALVRGGKALAGAGKGLKGARAMKDATGLGKMIYEAGLGLNKARSTTRGWMTGLAGQEGLKGVAGRTMLRGTQFKNTGVDGGLLKSMGGGLAMNAPLIAPMMGAQMLIAGNQSQYPQLQYNQGMGGMGHNYASGSNLGYNSIGSGYQNQMGGRFPQGQRF